MKTFASIVLALTSVVAYGAVLPVTNEVPSASPPVMNENPCVEQGKEWESAPGDACKRRMCKEGEGYFRDNYHGLCCKQIQSGLFKCRPGQEGL